MRRRCNARMNVTPRRIRERDQVPGGVNSDRTVLTTARRSPWMIPPRMPVTTPRTAHRSRGTRRHTTAHDGTPDRARNAPTHRFKGRMVPAVAPKNPPRNAPVMPDTKAPARPPSRPPMQVPTTPRAFAPSGPMVQTSMVPVLICPDRLACVDAKTPPMPVPRNEAIQGLVTHHAGSSAPGSVACPPASVTPRVGRVGSSVLLIGTSPRHRTCPTDGAAMYIYSTVIVLYWPDPGGTLRATGTQAHELESGPDHEPPRRRGSALAQRP